MKAVVYSFTRRGAMLSINIGEALQKFDFEVRCLTMPKFAEEKIFLEAMDDHNKACVYDCSPVDWMCDFSCGNCA